MLLGATLLPVAAVLSSEDIEMSASFPCPNESETTDEGDLSVIPHSVFYRRWMGVTFIILARCHWINRNWSKN